MMSKVASGYIEPHILARLHQRQGHMLPESNFSFFSTNIRKSPSTKKVVVSHMIQNLISNFAGFCDIYCMNGHLKQKNIFITKICFLLCNTSVNYQVSARITLLYTRKVAH